MSLAAAARTAVRARPFLHDALRAGVVNYTAAARFLDLGDTDAVTAALRRYAEELDEYEPPTGDARVTMQSGLGPTEVDGALLRVGDVAYGDGGSLTGILATGDVSPGVLAAALSRLRVEGIPVEAAAVAGDSLAVVVERRDGPDALRVVEQALE